MRAAIYARVSSAAQRDRHTIESQLRVLPEYVAAQGWTLVGTFIDDGRTAKAGHLDARDGFASLLRAAEARAFDLLVVVDVDRLTRTDSIEERAQILGPFQRLGIDIVTPSGGRLDMRTMLGELWVTIQALGAAAENRKRVERSMAGVETAIRRGRKGSGITPYGLRFDVITGEWSIDPIAGPIVREIFERIADGESSGSIADDLAIRGVPRPRGLWRRNRINEIVRARYPMGEWLVNRKKHLVLKTPAIVDEDLWQRANEALLDNKRRGLRRTKHVYLLEQLGTCGVCGAPMRIRSGSRCRRRDADAAYVCLNRRDPPLHGDRCRSPYIIQPEVDARVWAVLCRELLDPDLIPAITEVREGRAGDRRDWTSDVAGYEAHLERLDHAESALLSRFTRGLVTERVLDGELEDLRRRRDAVREQLATAQKASGAVVAAQARSFDARAMIEALREKLTPEADRAIQRELVQLLVESGSVIFVDGDVRLNLLIPRGTASAFGTGPSTRSGHESHLRIRLVA